MLALVFAVAAGFLALYRLVLHPLFLSPIARVPAVHPLAKLSPLYMLWIRFWDAENATVWAAHAAHGDVVRLGPRELSVNCVDDGVKTVYGRNFDRHYFYRVYEDCGRQNLSSSLDAGSHAVRKRRIAHVYSKSYVHSSAAVRGLVERLVRREVLEVVGRSLKEGRGFDTMVVFSALALDLVTGYIFGARSGTRFLRESEEHRKCIREIHNGRPYETLYWLHEFPGTVAMLERVGVLSIERYKSIEALNVMGLGMCSRAEAVLAESKTREIAAEDFPTVYQQFKRALDREGLSAVPSVEVGDEGSGQKPVLYSPQQLEIAAEVSDQIHASDETLSVTLTYAVWELSRDSEMQQRLRRECQGLGPDVQASSTDPLPSASAVDALPLLHAIIMETLRVHPVVAGGQARVTPYGKLSKLGRYEGIPGGYRVQSYARFLHGNAEVFPNPDAWYPERWLQTTGEGETKPSGPDQKLRWFWSFSSGARMCLGSHFALLVMKYLLVLTYSNFETYIVNDDGIEHMNGYVGGPKSGKLLVGARPVAYAGS